MTDPLKRFSNRVEKYISCRPHYPEEIISTLQRECGLTSASVVADIGSGTGALSKLFLKNGNEVFAVEPNREMRMGAERIYRGYPGFHSIDGRAEATTLPDGAFDFAAVGQAFHWFDRSETRREFLRILKPGGWAIVTWNEREFTTTPFLIAYDQLLQRYATDYAREKYKRIYDTSLIEFYGVQGYKTGIFKIKQEFDFDGVKGRMLSSSYTPEAGDPNHERMVAELMELFSAHQLDGRVAFNYTTWLYYGHLE
jgi:ubiquinone/menaquinone biosynthesis C-methylase UbiE